MTVVSGNAGSEPPSGPDEQPVHLRRTWSYYVAQVIVIPVRAIPLLSWIILGLEYWRHGSRLVPNDASSLRKLGIAWLALEAIFSLHHWVLVLTLSQRPHQVEQPEISHLRQLFSRILHVGLHDHHTSSSSEPSSRPVLPPREASGELNLDSFPMLDRDDPRAIDFRTSLRTWFYGSSWSSLTRSHMLSWLAWSMFNEPIEALHEEQRELIERALILMERRAGAQLPDDTGDTEEVKEQRRTDAIIKPLRLTLDPMSVQSRPLVAYLVINSAIAATKLWLTVKHGARYETVGDTEYLIRAPSGGSQGPPILFLHGLGVGLAQYIVFVSALLSTPSLANRTVLVPIQPHISQHVFSKHHLTPPKPRSVIRDLKRIVDKACVDAKIEEKAAAVVSHSNGTVVHAWLLKNAPEMVKSSCFVDPVTFCLWEGDVCYNFVYKEPTNGIELLMRYYVGSEIGIANCIQRNFDWSANTLFFEEIPHALDPSRTMFFVGGRDSILSGPRVRRYLKLHGVTEDSLVFSPGAAHGGALIPGGPVMNQIVDWIAATHS